MRTCNSIFPTSYSTFYRLKNKKYFELYSPNQVSTKKSITQNSLLMKYELKKINYTKYSPNEYDQDVGDGQETHKLYLDHLAIIIIIIIIIIIVVVVVVVI